MVASLSRYKAVRVFTLFIIFLTLSGAGELNPQRVHYLMPYTDWTIMQKPFLPDGRTQKVLCASDKNATVICAQYKWFQDRYMTLWLYMVPGPSLKGKHSRKWVADFQLGTHYWRLDNMRVDVDTFLGIDEGLQYVGEEYAFWRTQVSEPERALSYASEGFLRRAVTSSAIELVMHMENGKTQRTRLPTRGLREGLYELVNEMIDMKPGLRNRLLSQGLSLE